MPTLTRSTRRPDGAASLPPARGTGFSRGFTAMRHPNYRRFWFGQIGSLVGAWMQSVALPWLVLQLGGSPLQLGLVMAFMFGPSLFLAPLGGVLADRVDKRRMLIAVNAVAMIQASTLFVLALTGVVEIWHVYLLALVAGFVNAVEMPVRQAFVAELVPREDLVNAIALSSTSFNLSGPACNLKSDANGKFTLSGFAGRTYRLSASVRRILNGEKTEYEGESESFLLDADTSGIKLVLRKQVTRQH